MTLQDQLGNLHHAYMLIGDRDNTRRELFTFLEEKLDIRVNGNPDFSYIEIPTFNIEAARNLTLPQSMKDVGGSKKIFVIAVDMITEESQNALLKMFEEPTLGTHFFILAPQNNFLATFLSRVQLIRMNDVESADGDPSLQRPPSSDILLKTLPERLAFVAKLASDISDEKKTKQEAIALVNEIESELSEHGIQEHVSSLKACEFARLALMSRGAMVKMILENLMLHL